MTNKDYLFLIRSSYLPYCETRYRLTEPKPSPLNAPSAGSHNRQLVNFDLLGAVFNTQSRFLPKVVGLGVQDGVPGYWFGGGAVCPMRVVGPQAGPEGKGAREAEADKAT